MNCFLLVALNLSSGKLQYVVCMTSSCVLLPPVSDQDPYLSPTAVWIHCLWRNPVCRGFSSLATDLCLRLWYRRGENHQSDSLKVTWGIQVHLCLTNITHVGIQNNGSWFWFDMEYFFFQGERCEKNYCVHFISYWRLGLKFRAFN